MILFKGRRKRKYQMTFAKRVFMFFNVFYISRLLIIDQVSYTRHAQHLRLQMQIESRCLFFSLSFFLFFYSSLFHYLFKGFLLPCFFNETSYFSFSSGTLFFILVESMLRNYPHRRLIPMMTSVCNRTKYEFGVFELIRVWIG